VTFRRRCGRRERTGEGALVKGGEVETASYQSERQAVARGHGRQPIVNNGKVEKEAEVEGRRAQCDAQSLDALRTQRGPSRRLPDRVGMELV
jgi:hypothetical protein